MKNLLAILLAIIMTVNGVSDINLTGENIDNYISPDCETVANFILDNLSLLAQEYNNQLTDGETEFLATSCETVIPVYVVSTDQEGLYLDFNDNNGYMIVVDDYSVIAFETTGDIEYIKGLDYTYYSIYDGFLYLDVEGKYLPYKFEEVDKESWTEYDKIELGGSYAGQSSGTDGEIYDTTAFVKDKYGSGYVLYKQNSLSDYRYVTQWDLSIYYKQENSTTYSEGNCSLSSIFSLMNYLQSSGKYSKLPAYSSKTSYYATNDSFYEKYSDNTSYIIKMPKVLPSLYLAVRQYAVKNYNYEVSGTNPFDIESIIKGVGKQYGYSMDTSHILIWTYDSQVVKEIDEGYPTIWNMANSSTYGSHTTVVTGYKTYRKTTTILGINFYSYVQLLQLNDNWNSSARYFDFTNYDAFGSFVKVR